MKSFISADVYLIINFIDLRWKMHTFHCVCSFLKAVIQSHNHFLKPIAIACHKSPILQCYLNTPVITDIAYFHHFTAYQAMHYDNQYVRDKYIY